MGSDPQSHLEEQNFLSVDGQKIREDDWRKAVLHAAGLRGEIALLRQMLWIRHGCTGLYGDDGELQCSKCMIDFRRDPIQKIEARFFELGQAQLKADEAKLPDNVLWHQSGINPKGEPFVQLLRGNTVIGQMSAEEARDHARTILEAAEAAEQDSFMWDWVINRVGTGEQQAAGLLVDFRKFRRERSNKSGGPVNAREWVMPPGKEPPDAG
jgi:hypothetical protein